MIPALRRFHLSKSDHITITQWESAQASLMEHQAMLEYHKHMTALLVERCTRLYPDAEGLIEGTHAEKARLKARWGRPEAVPSQAEEF